MTILQSLIHYVMFTLHVIAFAWIGLVLSIVVAFVFNQGVAWIVVWFLFAFGCWFAELDMNEHRTLYPHCWPKPKW